jgi:hypothetical protein
MIIKDRKNPLNTLEGNDARLRESLHCHLLPSSTHDQEEKGLIRSCSTRYISPFSPIAQPEPSQSHARYIYCQLKSRYVPTPAQHRIPTVASTPPRTSNHSQTPGDAAPQRLPLAVRMSLPPSPLHSKALPFPPSEKTTFQPFVIDHWPFLTIKSLSPHHHWPQPHHLPHHSNHKCHMTPHLSSCFAIPSNPLQRIQQKRKEKARNGEGKEKKEIT